MDRVHHLVLFVHVMNANYHLKKCDIYVNRVNLNSNACL